MPAHGPPEQEAACNATVRSIFGHDFPSQARWCLLTISRTAARRSLAANTTSPPDMTLLDAHLEQISLCSASIAELPSVLSLFILLNIHSIRTDQPVSFPRPKIFTNALLHQHEITTLIRDTESHERALFSVPAPPKTPVPQEPSSLTSSNRRATVFNAPRRNTAVAAILGSELVDRIREGGGGGAGSGLGYRSYGGGRDRNEVDVETLLEGAEKLCGV